MSILSYGQRCVIVGGCPENIGLVVMVIHRLGAYQGREDAYWIRTVSGRPFHQLWMGNDLQRGASDEAITDRHKLRPLVEPKDGAEDRKAEKDKTLELNN
jgi:hypothetical protein